jgi:hypothetical protein
MRLVVALVAVFTIAGAGSAVVGASAAGSADSLGALAQSVPGGDLDAQLPEGYSNPRTAESAVQWALSQVGVHRDSGYCLRFVNLAYGRASGPPSAFLVWTRSPPALHHTSGVPPRGAVVVWSSVIGRGHGHIAISLGDGRMVSTTDGPVSVVPIAGFADTAYLGWMPPYFYM